MQAGSQNDPKIAPESVPKPRWKNDQKKRQKKGPHQKPVSIREREARYISLTSRKVGTTPASPENNNRFAHHGIPTTS